MVTACEHPADKAFDFAGEALDSKRYRVPLRTASTGAMGGGKFTRGQIYQILSNPTYCGEIHHKGEVHAGKHPAITDRQTWERVQAQLASNTQGKQRAASSRSSSLLVGLIVDEQGEPLVASHASKGKVRYRYYLSRPLQHDPRGPKVTSACLHQSRRRPSPRRGRRCSTDR